MIPTTIFQNPKETLKLACLFLTVLSCVVGFFNSWHLASGFNGHPVLPRSAKEPLDSTHLGGTQRLRLRVPLLDWKGTEIIGHFRQNHDIYFDPACMWMLPMGTLTLSLVNSWNFHVYMKYLGRPSHLCVWGWCSLHQQKDHPNNFEIHSSHRRTPLKEICSTFHGSGNVFVQQNKSPWVANAYSLKQPWVREKFGIWKSECFFGMIFAKKVQKW